MSVGCRALDNFWYSEWNHRSASYSRHRSASHLNNLFPRTSWAPLTHSKSSRAVNAYRQSKVKKTQILRKQCPGGGWGLSGQGVRVTGPYSPLPRLLESCVEPSPIAAEQISETGRRQMWVAEHQRMTQKHLSGRGPLPDRGKPATRRGRNATAQVKDLRSGLPEEG